MKKTISFLLFALFSVLLIPLSVSAASGELSIDGYVTDDAHLLTNSQLQMLENRAESLSNNYRCDVRIITIDDMADYGYSRIDSFSYNTFMDYGLGYGSGRDCVIFVLSMSDRDYDLRAWGEYALTAFTPYGIDDLLDSYVLEKLRVDDYYQAFSLFLDRAEVYFKMADEGRPFDSNTAPKNRTTTVVVLVIVSLLIAGIICGVWRARMKTAKIAKTAGNYIPQGGFRLTGQGDMFLYRTVTRTKVQSSSSSSGGAGSGIGGSSGRSGKF